MSGRGMSANVLEVRDLHVQTIARAPKRLLAGVSFDLRRSEILCLVGESGSGKSLTALSIMGLLPRRELAVTSGSVRLQGEELIGASGGRLRELRASRMAMIFQEPMAALNPVMILGAQIDEVLRAHTPLDRAERRYRIDAALQQAQLFDVERVASSYPHQLSGGERQRAMIAMALVLQPKLLVADEPTTALDVRTQKQILLLVNELRHRTGMAVLFITHDMGVVAEIADRVCVIRNGRHIEIGKVETILTRPRDPYTRRLLTAVPSLKPRAPRPQPAGGVVLSTAALSKTYRTRSWFGRTRSVEAVADVTLSLQRGRTLGLVGESGSGKSTLARCIVRLTEPTEGSIRLAGTEIAHLRRRALRQHRNRIQIVFQDPYRSLNPRLRVGEAIAEGPINFGMDPAAALRLAAEFLGRVGLDQDSARYYPHQFSGGQRQRIALARALVMQPDVLVADEPVSALDVSTQEDILRLLTELQDTLGIAILFITHDLRVAAQICDDLAIMRAGRVVEYGPAAKLLLEPAAPYTRELLESVPARHWDFGRFRQRGAGEPGLLLAGSPRA